MAGGPAHACGVIDIGDQLLAIDGASGCMCVCMYVFTVREPAGSPYGLVALCMIFCIFSLFFFFCAVEGKKPAEISHLIVGPAGSTIELVFKKRAGGAKVPLKLHRGTQAQAGMYACVSVCLCVCVSVCLCVCVCMCRCLCVYVCTAVQAQAGVCVLMYMHAHTHTHTQA